MDQEKEEEQTEGEEAANKQERQEEDTIEESKKMNLKTQLIQADIEDYKKKIAYCDSVINKTIKTKEMWKRRLENKNKSFKLYKNKK